MFSKLICHNSLQIDLNRVSIVTTLTILILSVFLVFVSTVYQQIYANPYLQVRFLYISGIILILPLIWFSMWAVSKMENMFSSNFFQSNKLKRSLIIFWSVVIGFLITKNNFLFFPIFIIANSRYCIWLLFFGIIFTTFCLRNKFGKIERTFYYFLILLVILLAYKLFFDYIFWFDHPNKWMLINFNATLSSIVQANHGMLPLVDYYAQYGYYSQFISFFFHYIPLNLTSYSIFMASLSIAIFVFLFLGIKNLLTNRFIHTATIISCFYILYYSVYIPYWANIPIRLFFPSLVFWLVTQYNLTKNSVLYYLIFFLATISIAWNMDTGFVLFFSWLCFISYIKLCDSCSKLNIGNVFKMWFTGFIFLCAMTLFYATETFLTRGVLPDYTKLFIFQDLFFGQGIVNVPMKAVDSWCLIILIYIVGFVYGLSGRKNNFCDKNTPIVMFLSFMGTGIFSYFIMRSYSTNIFIVSWPAVIILAIFADKMVKTNRRFIAFFILIPLISLSLSAISNAVSKVLPSLNFTNFVHHIPKQEWSQILFQREWIKSLGLQKKNVIILSDNSGIFYLDSGSINPVATPGATEIFSELFVNRIEKYMDSGKASGFILVDMKMVYYSSTLFDGVRNRLKGLSPISTSPDGALMLFPLK